MLQVTLGGPYLERVQLPRLGLIRHRVSIRFLLPKIPPPVGSSPASYPPDVNSCHSDQTAAIEQTFPKKESLSSKQILGEKMTRSRCRMRHRPRATLSRNQCFATTRSSTQLMHLKLGFHHMLFGQLDPLYCYCCLAFFNPLSHI